jgi:hypothetical protein
MRRILPKALLTFCEFDADGGLTWLSSWLPTAM